MLGAEASKIYATRLAYVNDLGTSRRRHLKEKTLERLSRDCKWQVKNTGALFKNVST